jgi:hypothetical protein
MRAHIVTACTRPHNLPLMAESIEAATCEPWEVHWHIRFDSALQHVGGQRLKNQMLDQIEDGWVCFLDGPQVLAAAHEHLQVGSVDIGQAFIARSLIGNTRIPEHYEGDGVFLQAVLASWPAVAYLPDILSEHNALEGVPA